MVVGVFVRARIGVFVLRLGFFDHDVVHPGGLVVGLHHVVVVITAARSFGIAGVRLGFVL